MLWDVDEARLDEAAAAFSKTAPGCVSTCAVELTDDASVAKASENCSFSSAAVFDITGGRSTD